MQINWFTVVAQVINFLILVWLLKRFLYKPILNAIDEREKKIASQLQNAEDQKAEAKKEKDEFNQKNELFDQEKKELMDKAIAETKEERIRLIEEARNEADKLSAKLEDASKKEQENRNQEIAEKIQHEVFAITRKMLADLASVSLEEQSTNIFTQRLNELKDDDKKKFNEAFKAGSNPIIVRSAFDLPEKQKLEIEKSVKEILGTEIQIQFKTMPELISGIELTTNEYKLSWSISGYLNSFEKSISEIKKEEKETTSEKR